VGGGYEEVELEEEDAGVEDGGCAHERGADASTADVGPAGKKKPKKVRVRVTTGSSPSPNLGNDDLLRGL
jgi:hypothetical protein